MVFLMTGMTIKVELIYKKESTGRSRLYARIPKSGKYSGIVLARSWNAPYIATKESNFVTETKLNIDEFLLNLGTELKQALKC